MTEVEGAYGGERRSDFMRYVDMLAKLIFAVASTFLMLLALAIIHYAGVDIYFEIRSEEMDIGAALLDAIGYTIVRHEGLVTR